MTEFFILAGGMGNRALPLSARLPKPLFPLGGIPLLKQISLQLRDYGLCSGYINVHHLHEKIRDLPLPGLSIRHIFEKELSGNRILSTLSGRADGELLVINGDTYLEIPFLRMIDEFRAADTDGVILVRKKDGKYSSIISDGNIFLRRDRDPEASDIMYTGVSIFRNRFLGKLKEENLFDSLESSGAEIRMVDYEGIWLDLGTPESYYSGNRTFMEDKGTGPGNSFSENVSVSENAAVSDSIIWENTVIKGNAVIRESIVTGNTEINGGRYFRRIITGTGDFPLSI